MRLFHLLTATAAFTLSTALLTGTASAALLIDFGTGTSPVQPDAVAQTGSPVTYGTLQGDLTYATNGSFFNRSAGGSYTDAPLMGDFNFLNSFGTMTITISGPAIAASTDYTITFYSYDSQHGSGGGTVTYTGVSGTTGSASIAYSNAGQNNPGFAAANSSTDVWTANSSGQIVIGVTGTNEGPRVSGVEFADITIPEPASLALLSLGGLLIAGRRRK